MDITKVIETLSLNDSIDKQIEALDAAQMLIDKLLNASLSLLKRSKDSFLIAERINNILSSIKKKLKEAYTTSNHDDVKELLSIMLLNIGDMTGVDCLIEAIANKTNNAPIAAVHLANHKIVEAGSVMLDTLYEINFDSIDLVVTLVQSYKKLGLKIPDEIVTKYTESDVPWQIKSLFRICSDGQPPKSDKV